MMTTTVPLTPGKATADALEALTAAGITGASIKSTDMGYCAWLGGKVIETEARVTWDQLEAAGAALSALPGARPCEYLHGCATVYRRVNGS